MTAHLQQQRVYAWLNVPEQAYQMHAHTKGSNPRDGATESCGPVLGSILGTGEAPMVPSVDELAPCPLADAMGEPCLEH